MELSAGFSDHEQEIIDLFTDVFTASESAAEGALIGAFVRELMAQTPSKDLFAFTAREGGMLLGCIFFSRLNFPQDTRSVFLLSPVAVRTDSQGAGVGQKLIRYGLDTIRDDGVDVAITYGDPAYYIKTGFVQITQDVAAAPIKLSHPHGWLGQSLSDHALTPLKGASHCVAALNRPELW